MITTIKTFCEAKIDILNKLGCSLRKVRNERVYVLVKFEKYEVSIQRGVLSRVMSRRESLKKR